MSSINQRVAEAYLGEYASGKSEVALNRAIALARGSRVGSGEQRVPVTLVDFDFVEPFYTLRPIQELIAQQGVDVLTWKTEETMGLGEAGNLIRPDMRWALRREGHVIFDVGYGVEGARKVNLIEDAKAADLKLYVVINIGRPMTADVKSIVEFVRSLGPVHGLINNAHLGDATEVEFIQEGARIVTSAASELDLPFLFTTADQRFKDEMEPLDILGNPVFFLQRYMNRAYW
jgi:hypothetical protein